MGIKIYLFVTIYKNINHEKLNIINNSLFKFGEIYN